MKRNERRKDVNTRWGWGRKWRIIGLVHDEDDELALKRIFEGKMKKTIRCFRSSKLCAIWKRSGKKILNKNRKILTFEINKRLEKWNMKFKKGEVVETLIMICQADDAGDGKDCDEVWRCEKKFSHKSITVATERKGKEESVIMRKKNNSRGESIDKKK